MGHSRKALEEAHDEAGGADDGGGSDVAPAEEGGAETIVHWRHTGASWCRDVHTHTHTEATTVREMFVRVCVASYASLTNENTDACIV